MTDLPKIPWEPQEPRLPNATDEQLASELRRRGWVAYKKRPAMRRGKVRLANGTVLVQTTIEEAADGEG